VINNAACIIFMVEGAEKSEVLRVVLADDGPPKYPSQLIRPVNGRLLWLVDQAAAKSVQS
jgi:6-phosphogluconolactonase